MAYRINLAVQILSRLPMVEKLKVCYPHFTTTFVKALKALGVTKLAKIMEMKGAKILKNVKT